MGVKVGMFAYGTVGEKCLDFVIQKYPETLAVVGYMPTWRFDHSTFWPVPAIKYGPGVSDMLRHYDLDYLILAWWPKIAGPKTIACAKKGVVNLHPSLLPYNRGKGYWFWNLVDNVPFGVTMHFITERIDDGPILFQKEIPKTWEDTGESLAAKARKAMVELFEESYPKLIAGEYTPKPQETVGPTMTEKSVDKNSEIYLGEEYTAQELLNLIRARSSDHYPKCFFKDGDKTYEVSVSIKEKK